MLLQIASSHMVNSIREALEINTFRVRKTLTIWEVKSICKHDQQISDGIIQKGAFRAQEIEGNLNSKSIKKLPLFIDISTQLIWRRKSLLLLLISNVAMKKLWLTISGIE